MRERSGRLLCFRPSHVILVAYGGIYRLSLDQKILASHHDCGRGGDSCSARGRDVSVVPDRVLSRSHQGLKTDHDQRASEAGEATASRGEGTRTGKADGTFAGAAPCGERSAPGTRG